MSQPLALYIDTVGQRLVAGPKTTNSGALPAFSYGDVWDVRLYFLAPNPDTGGGHPTPYVIISVSDLGAQMAIGDLSTGTPTTPVAFQNSWTKSADNTYLSAQFSLNTAEILAALGAGLTFTKTLEIKMDRGGFLTTVLTTPATVNARVLAPTSVVPQAGVTPISKEEVAATYVPFDMAPGQSITLKSQSGVYGVNLFVDNNGVLHTEAIVL